MVDENRVSRNLKLRNGDTLSETESFLDASVSLLIFEETVRLAATVAIENWNRTKIDRQRCRM